MASESIENYLKAIYKVQEQGEWATTGQVARRLGISAPSASRMLKKLSGESLVDHNPYKGVQLTREGRRLALRVIRNHRVLEAYFVKALGMSWDRVDAEVERIEHVVSDDLVNRMEEALGFPRFDPHGSPIPTRDGTLPELDGTCSLTELPVGARAEVCRIADAPPEALAWLGERGLLPGAALELVRQEPFRGPLVLRVAAREVFLGLELAGRIHVVDVSSATAGPA
ncbi:MAG: metal-dependent transcriptional regulator [Planctomycetota bacterium]